MAFEEILFRTWRDNTLFAVLLELTYRCNLDCYFCYNDLGLKGRPLSTERYLALLAELAELEVMNLILSGGEPLAHPDFFEIGRRARDLGFVVRVKSNGHGLRGKVARRLKEEVDPYMVDVSLHGARAATHDRQTRVPGSFDRLMENLPRLLDLGVRLKINATLTCWNEDEIDGMLEIADRLGVPVTLNPTLSPRDDGDREPLSIAASRDARLRLYRTLADRAERRRAGSREQAADIARPGDESLPTPAVDKSCGAGSSGVTVDPYGNVLPCVQWRRPVGNLHRQTMREIWEGSARLREVREQTKRAKRTVDAQGEAGRRMSFCAGLAVAHHGDPTALYDDAREQAELVGRALEEPDEGSRPGLEGRPRELLPVLG
jgi:radical SAM protein with 4Fe4S-binding SPASM domain